MRKTTLAMLISLVACGGGIIGEGSQPDPKGKDKGPPTSPGTAPTPTTPTPGEICGNGLDDNGDGQVNEQCACDPASQPEQACYPGAAAQMGVGQCTAGKQLCQGESEGEFSTWGPCVGAVLPGQEDCVDGLDNDCNGVVDDGPGCACKPGETRACYTGPAATRGKGQCKDGTETCDASGTTWLQTCEGQVLPAAEICHDKIDNDCDGEVDEGCIVTVNVNINGDCVWASCPPTAPYPVGCNITMAGDDCRGCVANEPGASKVYFQEGNQCGAGKVTGQLFCSSVPAAGLNAANCAINKKHKYYEAYPSGCPALGDGDGC